MSLALLDWRRSVAALYREVRATQDPAAAHQLWCEGRQALFSAHPESADRGAKLRVADYDPDWCFEVALAGTEPLRIEVATATDGVVPFERIGRAELPGLGALDVWWLDSYGGGVWLPFRDTSPDTYGGGRYLLDTVKGADLGGSFDPGSGSATLVVDLNFAYNPSCAYDERWVCPLAPEGNRLAIPVPVGEQLAG
ncbi:MAG TPA: DUF1684 domain-containing protein [Mycobacteriales bacterium]|jgi:hypothetical protein|nr:DUF1684 domain-containing protein [Mycobacteriales bacterium]